MFLGLSFSIPPTVSPSIISAPSFYSLTSIRSSNDLLSFLFSPPYDSLYETHSFLPAWLPLAFTL